MFIPTWQCKDGRLIPVNQMTDSHLAHCIRLIITRNWRTEWLERLQLEQQIRSMK